jgi:hypothetical protein
MRFFDLHCDTITKCCGEKMELYDNEMRFLFVKANALTNGASFLQSGCLMTLEDKTQ